MYGAVLPPGSRHASGSGDTLRSQMVFMVYVVLLTFLVLENGFIPTAFLPGGYLLLIRTGVLIYRRGVPPLAVIPLLIMATFFGTWLGYMQGRFLGHPDVPGLMSHLDDKHRRGALPCSTSTWHHHLITARHRLCAYRLYPYIVGANEESPGALPWWSTLISSIIGSALVGLGFHLSHVSWPRSMSPISRRHLYLPVIAAGGQPHSAGLALVEQRKPDHLQRLRANHRVAHRRPFYGK